MLITDFGTLNKLLRSKVHTSQDQLGGPAQLRPYDDRRPAGDLQVL